MPTTQNQALHLKTKNRYGISKPLTIGERASNLLNQIGNTQNVPLSKQMKLGGLGSQTFTDKNQTTKDSSQQSVFTEPGLNTIRQKISNFSPHKS